jgi:hypothetical protein
MNHDNHAGFNNPARGRGGRGRSRGGRRRRGRDTAVTMITETIRTLTGRPSRWRLRLQQQAPAPGRGSARARLSGVGLLSHGDHHHAMLVLVLELGTQEF